MTEEQYAIRLIGDGDEPLLQSFSCTDPDGAPWQREVELHIRRDLFYWLTAPGARVDDPRGLLMVARGSGRLVGVVAHRRADLVSASDVLMAAALTDIDGRSGTLDFVHALVHPDNVRSLALCRRNGLTTEVHDASYLRMITAPLPENARCELD